jgi:hypothetical protein
VCTVFRVSTEERTEVSTVRACAVRLLPSYFIKEMSSVFFFYILRIHNLARFRIILILISIIITILFFLFYHHPSLNYSVIFSIYFYFYFYFYFSGNSRNGISNVGTSNNSNKTANNNDKNEASLFSRLNTNNGIKRSTTTH